MQSSPNEPNRKMKLLDWIVVLLTADMMTTFLFATVTGNLIGIAFIFITVVAWASYEGFVAYQIDEGLRE